MAVYKVPQDVEADDKLIGPFSFRQFIYIIIAVIAIALAWGLAQLFIPLAIIPTPVIIFFGVLALPLRKDQPMEIYLAAVVSFYLKPKKRLWQPDGIQSLVEITAPHTKEIQRAKDLSQDEAEQRLSYLASIVDTRGWAVRGVEMPTANSPMQTDAYYDAQRAPDVLDDDSGVARSFESMISESDTKRRNEMVERIRSPQPQPQPAPQAAPVTPIAPDPYLTLSQPAPATSPPANEPHLSYNPYPTSIHQSVINPLGVGVPNTSPFPQQMTPTHVDEGGGVIPHTQPNAPENSAPTTSNPIVSPDIINLANNSDLSIETIAHEANRIHQKEKLPDDEVVISLR